MIRVLLVEDHRAFGESFARLLDRQPDMQVVERTTSVAECRRYVSGGGDFDVAIVDLHLPDGEGAGLIGEMREARPGVRAMVLTISFAPEDYDRAREAGASEVMDKAASLLEILATIRRLAPGP